MVIHAKNHKQKKVISIHICTGSVCKKCFYFSESMVFPNTGYCRFWDKPGLSYNDFCSMFNERDGGK